MVKTVKSHYEEDEEDDDEFSSRTPDGCSSQKGWPLEGKSSDGKPNVVRSKHSETEQRRRSKINERFQILRDLIPENDQKRDKASFLLEVIQYIQFLQEKLQMYEETYQGWSVEPSKLMPRRGTSGTVEGFLEQSHLIKNGYTREDCIGIDPTLLASAQNSAETELSAAALYKATEDPHMAANETVPFNMPLQPILFENVTVQPSGGSFEAEHFSSQPQSLYFSGKRDTTESVVPCYIGQEELKVDGGEAGISNMYSQRLLNTLNRTLASLGVDMSQANLRVQLNVGKHTNSGTAATAQSSGEDYDYSHKRLRTEQR